MKIIITVLIMMVSVPAFAQTAPTHAPAAPAASKSERRAVSMLLSAIHELPARAEFEKAATNPQLVLVSIAAGRGPIAERAVDALFMWPNDLTFTWATGQLVDPKTSHARLHGLLLGLATTYKGRATSHVTPFLRDADPQVRITAAAAIAKIRTDEAFAQLDAAIAAESDELVAAQMRHYARRLR